MEMVLNTAAEFPHALDCNINPLKQKNKKNLDSHFHIIICWLSSVMVSEPNTPDIPMAVGMR